MADERKEYKPGEEVPQSGIYDVAHDSMHKLEPHQVTVIFGKKFPPCNHCGAKVRFKLYRAAIHLSEHSSFK